MKNLNNFTFIVALIISFSIKAQQFDCPKNIDCSKGNVLVTAPEKASVYIDGIYTGKNTPCMLNISEGKHMIGVGLETKKKYLRKTVDITKKAIQVTFTKADKPASSRWKALFVGVPKAYGKSLSGKECTTTFTKQDLDDAYEFCKFNLREHIEPFSYGAIQWDIDRRDLTNPVALTKKENGWYTLEAEEGLAELQDIKPGMYDVIFFFWKEQEGTCSFKSTYFALAWLDPTSPDTKQTGYVTVKFNPTEIGVAKRLDWYKKNDPGVFTHEWLHVVIEQFYPNLRIKTPLPPKDKLILHAAQAYGYKYPWIGWYKDLISGRVAFGNTYRGIGPDAFLDCSVREAALGKCKKNKTKKK